MFVQVGLLLGVGACVYIYICMCLCVCVSVCACVFMDLGGREPGDRLCSGLELYPGSGV